ncbi:MAG: hypothetical protein KKC51_06695 [Verrucomicrobia bacterium]|nr:hypothetical protein [Verrucomicrobiota bacterium]
MSLTILKADPHRRVRAGIILFLIAAAIWTAWGHHHYFLASDPKVNFEQVLVLRQGYWGTGLRAVAERWSDADSPPVRLRIEGGFPGYLRLLLFFGERAPFMANVLVVPALLALLGLYIAKLERPPERRFLAALLAPCLLVSISTTAMMLWQLVLPFRDTLSHLLGFGALVLLPTRRTDPWRARGRLLLAGVVCGLSAWTRLSGILFAVPMGLHLLLLPGLGTWRGRARMMAWTAAGGLIGLLPLLLQNVLEGRGLMTPPQAASLFLQERTVRATTLRAGWHPLNFSYTWGRMVREVAGYFPRGFHLLVLAGLAGRLLVERRPRRMLPLLGGLLIFALFYACYHRTVTRYYFIIALFYVAVSAVALAWLADRLWRRLPGGPRLWSMVLGLLLAGYAVQAGLRSGTNPRRVSREWKDAQQFKSWLRQTIHPPYHILTSSESYLLWVRYFAATPPEPWLNSPLRTGPLQLPRSPLPEGVNLYLLSLRDEDGSEQDMWSRDALLNRYDLDESGPSAIPVRAVPAFGCQRIRPREQARREIAVEGRADNTAFVYLYLRDLTSTNRTEAMALSVPGGLEMVPADLQAGPNLIRLPTPPHPGANTMILNAATPTPSVVSAAWIHPGDKIHIPFSEYGNLASRALMSEGRRLRWRGYKYWGRDRAGRDDLFWSYPFFVWTNGTAIRLPRIVDSPPPAVVIRLYYTALLGSREDVNRLLGLGYDCGTTRLTPLLVHVNRRYDGPGAYDAFDFFHEIEIPAGTEASSLVLNMREDIPTLLCHGMTFFTEPVTPAIGLPAPPRMVSYQWNRNRARRWYYDLFEFPPWEGRVFRDYACRLAALVGPEDVVAADGWIRMITSAYGGKVSPARELLAGGRAGVDALLSRGCAVYVLDLDVPLSSISDAAREFRAHYDLEPVDILGPATRADAVSPAATARQVVLYRVKPP